LNPEFGMLEQRIFHSTLSGLEMDCDNYKTPHFMRGYYYSSLSGFKYTKYKLRKKLTFGGI
jgi:hypothetical protein